jgi:hypothetical protein
LSEGRSSDAAGRRAGEEPLDQPDKPSQVRYLSEYAPIEPPRVFPDDDLLAQALRPLERHRPRLTVVVDASPTLLAAWADAIPELVAALRRQPSMREVTVAYLAADGQTSLARLETADGAVTIPAAQLVADPHQQLVWLLTDGLGAAWRSGRNAGVLAGWASAVPVVILNVLGARAWELTDLSLRRVRLRGSGWADRVRPSWSYADVLVGHGAGDEPVAPGAPGHLVPVLELDTGWLGRWARLLTSDEPTWLETAAVIVEARGGAPGELDPPDPSPAERLENFIATASHTSRRLAGLLAVESLSERDVRSVTGVAGAGRRDLSEIFAAGILSPSGVAATFDILPEIRWELRSQVSRGDVDRVRRALVGVSGGGGQPGAPPDRPADTVARPGAAEASRNLAEAADESVAAGRPGETPAEPGGQPGPAGGPTPQRHPNTESDTISTMSSIARTGERVKSADESSTGVPDADASTPRGGHSVTSGTGTRPLAISDRLPRVWGNVPPRNPHFTGREDLLTALDARLTEGATTVLPEALHGMGGVGKTQLATEYVYRHLSDFDIIWWIPAERTVGIGNALVELGVQLGLDVGTEANVAIRQVVEALRLGEPYTRWLLVFDNADDPRSVRDYFPSGTHGRILVTSRNPSWVNVSHTLEVAVFRRQESVALLRSRGGPLTDEDADAVAAVLGDLPLAVEQAVTWRAETGMAAREYLRLLEDKLTELLSTPPADYPRPVTAAWNVALDRLAESNAAALELLQVCAYFAPEPISRQLLSRAHNETISPSLDEALRDPVLLGRAIRDVNRYALARIDHRDNSIVMHRLVQAVLVGRMTAEEQLTMRHGAHVLLAASDPNDPFNPDFWRTYADLYPHAIASRAQTSSDRRVRQLLLNEVDYLWKWGDHEVSCDLAALVHQEWQANFGEEDPYSLQMALRFGWGLFVIGRYREAAEINRRTFEVSARVHGPDAELTIEIMGNVGGDLRVLGDYAGALEVSRDAHRRAFEAFGPDDPQTLDTAHNVAVTLRLLGHYAEAAELDEDTWQRSIRLYGEDDDRSLSTLTGLNVDRREMGDYLGARAAQENIDARYRRLFHSTPDHPARLRASRTLAVALRKAGEHQAALALSRDVEQRLFHRYGGEDPAALAAALGLSIDLRHGGLLHEARDVGERTRARYAAKLGAMHPHTLATTVNLAIIDRLSGQPGAALDLDERTLAAFVERLGEQHPSALVTATNLASDLYALGKFQQAHDRDRATLALSTQVLGEAHPSTLAVAANLAIDLRALEQKEEALELQADTLTRLDLVLGREHPAGRQLVAGVRLDCDIDPTAL